MTRENRLWNALNVIAILVAGLVPVVVTVYTPPRPEKPIVKRLEYFPSFYVDITNFLTASLRNRVSFGITFDNKPVKNIITSTAILENSGNTPILPSDYYDKLTIKVDTPWSILAVVPTFLRLIQYGRE